MVVAGHSSWRIYNLPSMNLASVAHDVQKPSHLSAVPVLRNVIAKSCLHVSTIRIISGKKYPGDDSTK